MIFYIKDNIFSWSWHGITGIKSVLWMLMPCAFSIRPSAATNDDHTCHTHRHLQLLMCYLLVPRILLGQQAITWTNADLLSIRPVWINFSEILIKIRKFSFIKSAFENVFCEIAAILSRGKWVNVLTTYWLSFYWSVITYSILIGSGNFLQFPCKG